MLQVVLELYEKLTIILIDETDLLFEGGCPELRLIAPITLPLARAPWISQPEKPHSLAL